MLFTARYTVFTKQTLTQSTLLCFYRDGTGNIQENSSVLSVFQMC